VLGWAVPAEGYMNTLAGASHVDYFGKKPVWVPGTVVIE